MLFPFFLCYSVKTHPPRKKTAVLIALYSIIALAFVLAVGFLLTILSCALYHNWWPLVVIAIYILAPIPNALCGRCAGEDDIHSDYNSGIVDTGHFITGLCVVSGFCFPFVLAHAQVITVAAMIMSTLGGVLIYGTIIVYAHFFADQTEDYY
ncbi:vacuolar protein sorting 55-domain-containing protein [Sporodiniella umbellata]|nr:vacuolar protein sorting 55-domain-containing protein [Sporodiniella umbellata]